MLAVPSIWETEIQSTPILSNLSILEAIWFCAKMGAAAVPGHVPVRRSQPEPVLGEPSKYSLGHQEGQIPAPWSWKPPPPNTHTHMCPHIHSLLHVCTPHTLFHVHTLLPSSPMQYRSLFSSTPKPISLESVVIDESNSLRSAVVPNPEYYYSAKSCINLGDHLSQRRTHSFPFSAPRNADPICS